jgi:glycosyltransferase involved in cell wall biosynthesis
MTQTLTFSIITPSLNQGRYIEETIKSVLCQEGDFYIDYIIIDGGSTDNSIEIIKKYEQLLKEGRWPIKCRGIKYRWVSERDKGQVDAIEKGFAFAEGDVGAWLNSDDTYRSSNVFEVVEDNFIKHPYVDVLTGDGDFIDENGAKYGVHHVNEINIKELIYLDYHILQPATFMLKKVFKKERPNHGYNYCFDAEYFIRLLLKGYTFKKTNDIYACFRLYPETKTLSGLNRRYKESLRICKEYGDSPLYYLVSLSYRYWDIVLLNKYPASISVKLLTGYFRMLAYKIILGRWHR